MAKMSKIIFGLLLIGVAAWSCLKTGHSHEIPAESPESPPVLTESEKESVVTDESGVIYTTNTDGNETAFGDASFYDYDFDQDGLSVPCPSRTSRRCYTHGRLVAASRDFRRWSTVKVTNLANGKSVEVLITDFGPDKGEFPERILDLSSYAFSQIADLETGVIYVKAEWPVPDERIKDLP